MAMAKAKRSSDGLTQIIYNYTTESDELDSDHDESSTNMDREEEYMLLNMSDLRQDIQCAICLGIIRKTRTVMGCLHRFCKECIDKSMRLRNNECPTCRTHCASRRALRDDPNFDALIAAICPDIDQYEEEELALDEDEMTHNKKVQASIAATRKRQTAASRKKRRRRRKSTNAGDLPVSNGNENMNDNNGGKDSSVGDAESITSNNIGEQESQFPQHPASTDADGAGDENIQEVLSREISASSALACGKNAQQSHPRVIAESRVCMPRSRLIDHLRNPDKNNEELSVPLMLVSFDEKAVPSLEKPYIVCENRSMRVKKLCEFVARKIPLQVDEVELWLVLQPQESIFEGERTIDAGKDKLRVLGEEETLAEVMSGYDYENTIFDHLIMAYKKK